MPAAFLARIRKLGELGVSLSDQERSGQAGVDIDHSVEHALELGVALKCLDIGLKQSAVAYLISHIREGLCREYWRIMESPPAPRQRILASDRPASPVRPFIEGADPEGLGEPNHIYLADTSY